MITRLLVGIFTPAMRATAQSPSQPRAILRGGCTHPSVRWRPAPAEMTPNAKSPMRSLAAPGPRTRSGLPSYRGRVRGRQPALLHILHGHRPPRQLLRERGFHEFVEIAVE